MKLFTRTLLFFVGVIAFQSILTFLLVTNVTRRADLAEAKRELQTEAVELLDGFNSWKRQLWISLVGMGRDERLGGLVGRTEGSPDELSAALVELLYVSKADCLVLDGGPSSAPRMLTTGASTLAAADVVRLGNRRTHPYLSFSVIRDVLYLVGVTALPVDRTRSLDVYLVKRIDADFCTQLALGRRSRVALYLGGSYQVGSPGMSRPWVFDPSALECAYLALYNERADGGWYNVALQWAGGLGVKDLPAEPAALYTAGPEDLFLGVFLSNHPYADRIHRVSRVLLLVSLAGGLLTMALSLLLSRNITHPVAQLVGAMERIAGGAFETRVPLRGGPEIRKLSTGLNQMARELHQRREAMQDHIRETTLLKEYNERIIDSIRAGIAIVDQDHVVEKANDAFVDAFALGGREVTGRPLEDLGIDMVDPSLMGALDAIARGEREHHTEVKRAADERVFEIALYPFYGGEERVQRACVFVAQDITAKTELEHKIFLAEKLSTITMLSAGMAHEINNPVGSILSNTQNLLAVETTPERRESLLWIEQEARRVARIVQELLRFAAPDQSQTPGTEVNAVIRDVVRLVDSTLGAERRIRIETSLSAEPLCTILSPDELKQVTINLIENSIQAIEGSGKVTITTRSRSHGRVLTLTVSDTGGGIPKAVLPRIFDPFFSTKGNGLGTGLGLSVVYGIVTKHHGSIRVRSREGTGTRFTLELPTEAAS